MKSIQKAALALGIALLWAVPSVAMDNTQEAAVNGYARVLAKYVNEQGLVNYRGIKSNPDDLDHYLGWAGSFSPSSFESFSKKQKLAFWINTYNAATLKLILNHHPIQSTGSDGPKNSIKQIPGNWDKVQFKVMGKKMTLNDMEHGTIRKQFDEPGVHVALVCAAKGCPLLLNKPYTADALSSQLEDQARRYFASSAGFKLDRGTKTVYLSSIYDWFKDDFVPTYGKKSGFSGYSEKNAAVLRYVSRYVSESSRKELASGKFTIKYLPYDWSLNEQ